MKENNLRSFSALEILRIIFLLFLISTHYYSYKWMDVHIIKELSSVSVSGFALITGMFVFSKRSLIFRNISRLLFIICLSFLIGGLMSISNSFSFSNNIFSIATGSEHIWYLYAILPVYIIGPLMHKKITNASLKNILLTGIFLFAIGISGWWAKMEGGYETFYIHGFGLIFSFFFLVGIAIFGFALKKALLEKKRWKNILLMSIFLFSNIAIILFTIFCKSFMAGHGNPLTTFSAISCVGIAVNMNFYSKKINWLSKRLYFVYEFHWYWIILFKIIFWKIIDVNPHAQIYLAWFIIIMFGSVMSIIITELQMNIWNKYVDPQMLKVISWTKSKLIKPKVSN